jgi:hypothetical protein
MPSRSLAALTALVAVFGAASRASAQLRPLGLPEGAAGGMLVVSPMSADAAAPLFAAGPQGAFVQGGGTAGGYGVSAWGALEVGFDYIRPFWTSRDFTLVVPAAAAGSFPVFGDVGSVDSDFAFAPRIDYHYRFADSDYGVRASGTFLSLTGHLQRGLSSTPAGAVGDLTANSSLTVVSANLVEFTRQVILADLLAEDDEETKCLRALKGWLVDLGIGTRYSSVSQNYTGSLTSGPGNLNMSTRYSSQSFQGVGLTVSAKGTWAAGDNLVLFNDTRCSLLVGENRKDSTLTVAVAGQPGQVDTLSQSRSEFIPVVECEVGVEWGRDLTAHLWGGSAAGLLTVRAALVGQYWGDVGPLSAGSPRGFSRSDLFLVGANVMVGLHR